ncbi:MAG: hypothetical protein HXX16_11575 [Bacteroidales bacterium]|nr:hypothetical protein [Bacteroidales bacterium]
MYLTLFNINALHNYYKSGVCKKLAFIPTEDCLKNIKNHKLIFRQSESGFKIAYKSIDESGTPLIDPAGNLFTFTITLKDANELLNITNLKVDSKEYTAKKIIYFTNNPVDNKTITHKFIDDIKPHIFSYKFPFTANNSNSDVAKLEVLNMEGSTILGPFTSVKPDKDCNYFYKIDLSAYPRGKYTFRVSDSTNDQVDELIYIDNDLSKQSIFGLLEIDYNNNTLDEYNLSLIRQESFWKYLIVNKSDSVDLDSFSLNILDSSSEHPSPYEKKYDFEKGEEPDSHTRISGFDTVIFTSKSKIPFYEDSLLNIELLKTDRASDPSAEGISLIKHLPNPKLSGIINKNSESEIYVFI